MSLGGPIMIFYDDLGYCWNYYYRDGWLILDEDNSEDGGYYFETVEQAEEFLKDNYGLKK